MRTWTRSKSKEQQMPNDLMGKAISGTKKLSFWDTKEGTTGLFCGVGFLALGAWGLSKILPFIIALLANTITAIVLGAVLLALLVVILDGKLPRLLWMMYKRAMWALTYSFVKYDPAWLARDRQKVAKARLETAADAREKLKGEQKKIQATINGFQADAKRYQDEANYLQTHNGSPIEIRARAGRLQDAVEALGRLQPGADQLAILDARLKDVFDMLKEMNISLDYKIEAQCREYEASNALGSVMNVLKSAFRGSDEVEGLRDQALNYMSEESNSQFGRIDAFLEDVDKFMKDGNLTNAIKQDNGLKLLEDLNAQTLQLKVKPLQHVEAIAADGSKSDYWTGKH
jgi:hypothetical protein